MRKKVVRKFKDLILLFVFNRLSAKLFLRPLLFLHSLSYSFSGRYAGILNNGVHPKHSITKYKEWFADNIHEDWVVLDVGSNKGIMTFFLSQHAKFVYGIEIVPKLVELAKAHRSKKNIEYICADVTSFDFSELQEVDCVTLSNVLEHIKNRVQFLDYIKNNIRWRDNKRILIRVPMIDRDWISVYKKNIGMEYRLDHTHFIEYTFEDFQDELNNAGIEIISYEIKFGEIYAVCGTSS